MGRKGNFTLYTTKILGFEGKRVISERKEKGPHRKGQ